MASALRLLASTKNGARLDFGFHGVSGMLADTAIEFGTGYGIGQVYHRYGHTKAGKAAPRIVAAVGGKDFTVRAIERKEKKRNPVAPFITSRLQQEAARKLRFSPKKTMVLAQQLYEGMEIGKEGPLGLITYMRTDSTRISDDAMVALIGERLLPSLR